MGNKSTSGIFVPLVKLTRAAVGQKQFNQLRGKGISLHSQGGSHDAAHSCIAQHSTAQHTLLFGTLALTPLYVQIEICNVNCHGYQDSVAD